MMAESTYSCTAILVALLASWVWVVNQNVPQPYLDEVFHIPQAQRYCAGYWRSWDPKITTPPGLYLSAAILSPIFGCSTTILRVENAVCLIMLFYSLRTLSLRKRRSDDTQTTQKHASQSAAAHIALNTVLFPPLFFFAALYYTDVASTLSVVIFLNFQRSSALLRYPQAFQALVLFILGLWTLLFRQTNIFWVAIYPAATVLVQQLDKGHDVVRKSMHERKSGFGDSWSSIVKTSYKMKVVYNPAINGSQFEDYIKCLLSILVGLFRVMTDVAALADLVIALIPYIALLIAFVGFILWNGSVVLGDKSNHVATLHLPQMLYLWPYIVFFTWPVLLPHILNTAAQVLAKLPYTSLLTKQLRITKQLPYLRYLVLFTIAAAGVVHYNTIIHPFTLADNRHYTFYVFRLLMRPWWMRYAVIPIYALVAWLCIQGLATIRSVQISSSHKTQQNIRPAATESSSNVPSIAFVLIWLGTTTLQLITAPLVEPRYFILPWLIWRISIPPEDEPSVKHPNISKTSWPGHILSMVQEQRLWLETLWYIVINATTGYLFLYRGFTWPSEPGNVQRFMW